MSEFVLIIDDVENVRTSLKKILEKNEYNVKEASNGTEALKVLSRKGKNRFIPDIILLDVHLPDIDGLDLLEKIKKILPETPVIIITGHGTIAQSVNAIKRGASDYILKPFNIEELILRINRIRETNRLQEHVGYLSDYANKERSCVWGSNNIMKGIRARLNVVAESKATTVLIYGETGTGKEVIARTIHGLSNRKNKPFVAVNATALSRGLLESELFGHEEGAFTGAAKLKKGLFEVAEGGTLFLDEIGDMDMGIQAKVLRALEDHTIRRVGGVVEIPVNIRIIFATNKNLEEKVQNGDFREDLYYRLSVIPLSLPPLRDRKEDIEVLAYHFVCFFNNEFKRHVKKIAPMALNAMMKYSWPGNVRELRNMIERAILLECDGEILNKSHLLFNGILKRKRCGKNKICLGEHLTLDIIEREHIEGVLSSFGGNKNQTAKILGIDRTTLYNKLRKYQLI